MLVRLPFLHTEMALHPLTFNQRMRHNASLPLPFLLDSDIFCTHPPSTASFRITSRCLSVHPSLVFLRSIANRVKPNSFAQFLTLVFGRTPFPVSRSKPASEASSSPSRGQTNLMSTLPCPSNDDMCHCGHLMPKSRVSHQTAPAGPLTSKICFLHTSSCSAGHYKSIPLLPTLAWPWSKALLQLRAHLTLRTGKAIPIPFSGCCRHLPPQEKAFCSCNTCRLSSPRSRRNQARPQQLPHSDPHVVFQ